MAGPLRTLPSANHSAMLAWMGEIFQPRVVFNAALLREPYSGVEVMIHETACALATHGTLPYCIYTPRTDTRPIPSRDRVQIRAVVPNRTRAQRILWEQCTLPRRLRADRAQVLHAPAYVAPLRARCPVVLTVHDLHVFTHPQFCTAANRLYYRLLLPFSIQRAAAITVYSEHVRRTLLSRFPAAEARTHVIPPGISACFLQPVTDAQRATVRARLNLPPKFILFVGNQAPRKNLPGVLATFELLRSHDRDLHLVLAGAASNAPDAKVARAFATLRSQRSLASLRSTSRRAGTPVHWLDYVEPDDLPALYAMAGALVFPSFDEGFGLPALEAMACGCPVVCSPGGAAEVCGEAALVCDPSAPASIAAALTALHRDPTLRRAKVAAGLHRAAQFRWERTIHALETLYREMQFVSREAAKARMAGVGNWNKV